jgi:hypothetical protein
LRERLRGARQRLHELFPMSDQLWLDWVNDELKQVKVGPGQETRSSCCSSCGAVQARGQPLACTRSSTIPAMHAAAAAAVLAAAGCHWLLLARVAPRHATPKRTSPPALRLQDSSDIERIKGLYQEAVQDYLSVDVWAAYLDFVSSLLLCLLLCLLPAARLAPPLWRALVASVQQHRHRCSVPGRPPHSHPLHLAHVGVRAPGALLARRPGPGQRAGQGAGPRLRRARPPPQVRAFDPEVSEDTKAGAAAFRALCESALTAAGLHLAGGGQLWRIYREFELQQEGGGAGDDKQVRAAPRRRCARGCGLGCPAGRAFAQPCCRGWPAPACAAARRPPPPRRRSACGSCSSGSCRCRWRAPPRCWPSTRRGSRARARWVGRDAAAPQRRARLRLSTPRAPSSALPAPAAGGSPGAEALRLLPRAPRADHCCAPAHPTRPPAGRAGTRGQGLREGCCRGGHAAAVRAGGGGRQDC